MDDIRDTRPWFWILTFVLFAIAVVALIIAISANNNSVDEQKLVKDATAQIEEELSGLHGALEAADEFQEESNELARQDRARIKREVNAAIAGTNERLARLNNRVGKLEKGQEELKDDSAATNKSVNALGEDIAALEEEVAARERKVKQLSGG